MTINHEAGRVEMTAAEWRKKHADFKSTRVENGIRLRSCLVLNDKSGGTESWPVIIVKE